MDSYLWYTHTIHQEVQERLHDRMQGAEQGQLPRARRHQRVLLIIANRLIATGHWLKAYARPATVSQ